MNTKELIAYLQGMVTDLRTERVTESSEMYEAGVASGRNFEAREIANDIEHMLSLHHDVKREEW